MPIYIYFRYKLILYIMSDIYYFTYYLNNVRSVLRSFFPETMIPLMLSFQIATANRLKRLLQSVRILLNITPMGGGKTYYTIENAWHFRLPLIVIGLSSMQAKWTDVSKAFGVPLLAYYNFTGINGKHSKQGFTTQPKCPLLNRIHVPNAKNDGKDDYYQPTELLRALIDAGVMIVFDEASKLKNESMTFLAAWTICQYVQQVNNTRSKIVHLSASPADRTNHISQLLGLMGINNRPRLYTMDRTRRVGEQITLTGFHSVREWARRYDVNNRFEDYWFRFYGILPDLSQPRAGAIQDYSFRVWTDIVAKKLLLGGPAPELSASIWNVFCNLEPQHRPALRKALAMMKDAITQDEFGRIVVRMEVLQQSLLETSRAKRPLVVNLARNWLHTVPNSKVIIADMFHESVDFYAHNLYQYNPVMYTGHVDVHDREFNRRRFVDPYDSCRALICTLQTGQMGVDMDSKDKNMNILLILLPTYHFLSMYQMSGRVTRADTASMPTIIVPYVYDDPNEPSDIAMEMNLLSSIAAKTENTKAILGTETGCLPFPGEYPGFVMPDLSLMSTLPLRKLWHMLHDDNETVIELALQHNPPFEYVEAAIVTPMRDRQMNDNDLRTLGLLVKYGYTNTIRPYCTQLGLPVQFLKMDLLGLCWDIAKRRCLDIRWMPKLLREHLILEYGDRSRFSYYRP